ncbi:hypothetical protein ILUMI_14363 [Ignelater luminosus]|uniref:Uncharacterized protein n=1 Tax=Ignelater luminosus TaxID=2038154 RepID=A0A8K0G4X4_IGNLU|nr:hypothetical protein ILUMI_14363 [Ignelater luminosus]
MALINQRLTAEIPNDWTEHFRVVRQKPSPFVVKECHQTMFGNWSEFFKRSFRPKCPFAGRPIRELRIEHNQPQLIFHREIYNGPWTSSVVTFPPKKRKKVNLLQSEFEHVDKMYTNSLPISALRYQKCSKGFL